MTSKEAPLSFDEKLLIESVRTLEEQELIQSEVPIDSASTAFPSRMKIRSLSFPESTEIRRLLASHKRRLRSFTLLVVLMMAIVGSLAAGQAFSSGASGQTVNFFWLLLILLGLHFVMLVVWLASFLLSTKSLSFSPLSRIVYSLTRRFPSLNEGRLRVSDWLSKKVSVQLISHWLGIVFSRNLGFWRLSMMSHSFWLAYLTGGFLMILLMLSTRQFSFVWETTILDKQAFLALTETLATLPELLGFSVPDRAAVELSRPDVSLGIEQAEELRGQWASLLLASILLYGCLIRAVLLCVSAFMLWRSEKNWELPLQEAYYVNLRHRFALERQRIGVVDADQQASETAIEKPLLRPPEGVRFPIGAAIVAFELSPMYKIPPIEVEEGKYLGHAVDRQSQQDTLAALRSYSAAVTSAQRALVVCCDLFRTADRGVERYLGQLCRVEEMEKTRCFIALVHEPSADKQQLSDQSKAKLVGWYQLAADLDIPAEHLITVAASTNVKQIGESN